ncbi:TIGR02444 family protein [Halomonas almeriensis]|uniref:TIGR02444 family protein n=1 Tax=Halomonas almeriensis TaxID=308163 RepID=UPI0025B4569B|nr:TIGR02444 family protein [Halomonas almeriensis]MDN3552416.1 TIGR02444 family protein [Halomonas almeriensis]
MSDDSTELSAALRAQLALDPLWDFALGLYAGHGVEAACLTLQDDAGLEVTELLWRCWLYRHALHAGAVPAALRDWQGTIITPLRRIRRDLKAEARTRPSVSTLRQRIKQAEQDAEQECLQRLENATLDGVITLYQYSLPRPPLEKVVPYGVQLQKKSHLFALATLESQLDPP